MIYSMLAAMETFLIVLVIIMVAIGILWLWFEPKLADRKVLIKMEDHTLITTYAYKDAFDGDWCADVGTLTSSRLVYLNKDGTTSRNGRWKPVHPDKCIIPHIPRVHSEEYDNLK